MMRFYQIFSLCSAIIFAVVGCLFLFFADPILMFFNSLSIPLGFPQAPLAASNFYLGLAFSYMYLVTLLAFMMFRYPKQPIYSFVLMHGKLASSLVSLFLFVTHQHYLIYAANFIIDGCIATSIYFIRKVNFI